MGPIARMALISCPECRREVSSAAPTCPACGYPVAAEQKAQTSTQLLAEIHPSWWRFFWHLFFFWLIVPPVIAWWQRAAILLRIYPSRLTVERGIFAKSFREFRVHDIRSVDIDQSFLDRMVGIGDLSISTAATTDASERINGIRRPHDVRDLILRQREGQEVTSE